MIHFLENINIETNKTLKNYNKYKKKTQFGNIMLLCNTINAYNLLFIKNR